jgi:hypothetical protein
MSRLQRSRHRHSMALPGTASSSKAQQQSSSSRAVACKRRRAAAAAAGSQSADEVGGEVDGSAEGNGS